MSATEEDGKKLIRMIARKDFKVYREKSKGVGEAQKSLQEWIEKMCDENGWWPEDWVLRAGLVFMPYDEQDKSMVVELADIKLCERCRDEYDRATKQLKKKVRVPQEITVEARKLLDEVSGLTLARDAFAVRVAMANGVPPNYIDFRTGVVQDVEVEEGHPSSELE